MTEAANKIFVVSIPCPFRGTGAVVAAIAATARDARGRYGRGTFVDTYNPRLGDWAQRSAAHAAVEGLRRQCPDAVGLDVVYDDGLEEA